MADYSDETYSRSISPVGAQSIETLESEVAILNAQVLQLEEQLEAQAAMLEAQAAQASRREKELTAAASVSINAIFGAIPIRCGMLESGRLVIRGPSGELTAEAAAASAPLSSSSSSASASSLSPAAAAGLTVSAPPSQTPSPAAKLGKSKSPRQSGDHLLATAVCSSVALSFDAAHGVRGACRFKNAYTGEKPRVVAWVQRAGIHTVERLPSDTIRVAQTGFEFCIAHEDPAALYGSIVNWIAVSPPPSNPALLSTMAAIMNHSQPTLPSDLEKMVNKFLHGNSVSEMDSNGQALLHTAAYAGITKLAKLLLSKGAQINAVDEHGWTALLCAISPGHFDTALLLLKAGADCTVASESENNALHYLVRLSNVTEEYLNIMRLLVKGGCNPNNANQDGDTPLMVLCQRNPRLEAVEALIKLGASPNVVNNAGMTPMHIAIITDNTALLGKLLECGADPEAAPASPLGTPVAFAAAKSKPFALAALTDVVNRKHAASARLSAGRSPSQATSFTSATPGVHIHPRTLIVEIIEARDLGVVSDVYAVLRAGKQERRTQVAFQSSSPRWGESFRIESSSESELVVNLWSWHMAKSSVALGSATLSLLEAATPGSLMDEWLPLVRTGTARQPRGSVHVRITVPAQTRQGPGGRTLRHTESSARLTLTVCGKMTEIVSAVDTSGMDFVSAPLPREEWVQVAAPSAPFLVDASCAADGFHIEASAGAVTHKHDTPYDFDPSAVLSQYIRHFSAVPHTTVFGIEENQPIVFSIEDVQQQQQQTGATNGRKLIMRTKKEDLRMLIPWSGKNEVAAIKAAIPTLSRVKLTCSRSVAAVDLLKRFDKLQTVTRYKFGLLYAAPGQSQEEEFLNNRQTSPGFESFLNFIGQVVELKGFMGYNAGLDTRGSNNTGTHSVYSTFGEDDRKLEIMFHVATMLPFQEHDSQKVERKRHIGNDVVVLIYKESSGPDDTVSIPSFVSHFNHVFVVVSPIQPASNPPQFRVCVTSKAPVKPFPPYLPASGNVFKQDDEFRTWLLKKLINGERTAMEAPDFRGSMMNTRKTMLMGVIEACQRK